MLIDANLQSIFVKNINGKTPIKIAEDMHKQDTHNEELLNIRVLLSFAESKDKWNKRRQNFSDGVQHLRNELRKVIDKVSSVFRGNTGGKYSKRKYKKQGRRFVIKRNAKSKILTIVFSKWYPFKVYLLFCSQMATKPWLPTISFTDEFHSSTNRD